MCSLLNFFCAFKFSFLFSTHKIYTLYYTYTANEAESAERICLYFPPLLFFFFSFAASTTYIWEWEFIIDFSSCSLFIHRALFHCDLFMTFQIFFCGDLQLLFSHFDCPWKNFSCSTVNMTHIRKRCGDLCWTIESRTDNERVFLCVSHIYCWNFSFFGTDSLNGRESLEGPRMREYIFDI